MGTEGKTVQAGYICRACGADRMIDVRERAAEEGVENFLYHVARMAGEDHGRVSPGCRSELVDLKLPMSSNGIGYAGDPLTDEEKQHVAEQLKR